MTDTSGELALATRRALLAKLGVAGVSALVAGPSLVAMVSAPDRVAPLEAALGPVERFTRGSLTRVTVVATRADAWLMRRDEAVGAVWVVRDAAGDFTVLSTICPHLGCGTVSTSDGFVCPCHDSHFSRTGARDSAKAGPAPRDLDPLPHRVAEGTLHCTWVRFKPGRADRVREVG